MVALSILIAGLTSVGFPRATSNASSRHDHSPDATTAWAVDTGGSSRICPIDWRQSTSQIRKLIRCAATYHGVDPGTALYIAWRESRYYPSAYNAEGDAAGVYQHLMKYWPDRAETYGFPGSSPFNARANIFVTMRMVREFGWAPWDL